MTRQTILRACVLVTVCTVGGIACIESQPVMRTANTPYQSPSLRTGQPMERTAELQLSTPALFETGAPELGDFAAGVQIPRIQGRGEFRLGVLEGFDIGLAYEHASTANARPLDSQSTSADSGGLGLTSQYSLATRVRGLRVGLTAELLMYSVGYSERSATTEEQKRTLVPVISAGLVPSYRRGPITLFGSVSVRNQPWSLAQASSEDAPVTPGPLVPTVSAGLAFSHRGVRAALVLFQPLRVGPVAYRPTVAAAITIPLSRKPRARPINE